MGEIGQILHAAGALPTTALTDRKYGVAATLTRDARVVKLSAYLDGRGQGGAGQLLRAAIYSATLQGLSDEVAVSADQEPSWVDLPLAVPVELDPGSYTLALHFGVSDQAARYWGVGGGTVVTDTYSDGTANTFGSGSGCIAPLLFATYTNEADQPLEDDSYWARRGFWSAQEKLGWEGPVKQIPPVVATCGWHGTYLDAEPQGASFGLVQRNGSLVDYVGERVRLTNQTTGRSVVVFVSRSAELDTGEEISITRRAFAAISELSADDCRVRIEVIAEAVPT